MLRDVLAATDRFEILGEAGDGETTIALCQRLSPDVLTLDLSMPKSTGLDVLAALAAQRSRVRVVVVSSFSPTLVERALDVLDAGASDLVAKPKPGESFAAFGEAVAAAVAAAATGRRVAPTDLVTPRVSIPRATRGDGEASRVLAIACSTGGPRSLGQLVPALGTRIGAGGVIVQHMPVGFTAGLARRLDNSSQVTVREAATGDRLAPDTLLVAPGGSHLRISSSGAFSLDDSEPIGGIRPRADVTIEDLVRVHGSAVVLAVLTGMGNDGLAGARAVREAGGIVLAQDERDCVVYGMPRHIIEHDLADATGTLDELAVLIERAMGTPISARRR